MNMGIPFAPDPSWQLMDDGTLWWGFGGEYRILHLSPAGDTLREILSGAGAIAVTSEEIEEWAAGESPRRFVEAGGNLDLGRIPKQKPYFTDLYVDPAGRLWVDVPTVDGLTSFDVFDAEGRLLGRVDTGVQRDAYVDPIVRDDLLYMVANDELDVQNVSVFRILMAVRPAGDPG
jgi:streptogramin lyase